MLLTSIQPCERHLLGGAVRDVSWSHTGRLMALGADGRAMIDSGARLTKPIGPDPIACSWIGPDRVAVVDGVLGVIVAGGGSVWLAGGASGLVVVDVALGCVDQRIEVPGMVSLAVAAGSGRVATGDSTRAIHVLDAAEPANGTELSGYPDAVRQLDITPGGDVVVACADDELTWWSIGTDGEVADEPECTIGHDAPITTCSIGATGFVATGDLAGVVRLRSPRRRDLPLGAVHLGGEVTVLAWSRSGLRLAIGTAHGEVLIADVEAGGLV